MTVWVTVGETFEIVLTMSTIADIVDDELKISDLLL